MTQRWFKINTDLLNDRVLQTLPDEDFKAHVLAAFAGQQSIAERFIRPLRDRGGAVWAKLRSAIFARDDFTCGYCGKRGGKLECDHIHPRSKGGSDHPSNLVTACFSCNRSKRDKLLTEWGGPCASLR